MKYRPKNISVDAFQYNKEAVDACNTALVPIWYLQAVIDGTAYTDPLGGEFLKIYIGNIRVNEGDYVYRDKEGEMHVSTAERFEDLYERAE